MPREENPSVPLSAPAGQQRQLSGVRSLLLVWPLFFAICFGLGYPSLQRFDPRTAEGLSDTPKYYALVTGADTSNFREIFRCRLLVPYVARPFYWLAQSHLRSWNPGFFALLMANALFCATTACLIASIGQVLLRSLPTALLGATLYLLSFAIPDLQLSGLIDSGEACFMAALVWSLLAHRWQWLPLWGILGALAKETFVPFACVFALVWWLVELRQHATVVGRSSSSNLKWIVALAFAGLTTVMVVHTAVAGEVRWPWTIVGQSRAPGNFLAALWRCVNERNFWYVFGWLLPFGIWRLKAFPKPWLFASLAASALALLLGALIDAGGTVARPIFDIVGPLLSLSVALLLAHPSAHTSGTSPEN
jgi:uncharacterized membrane protein